MTAEKPTLDRRIYASHPRAWERFSYVYPVFSRRAKGLSIGINLNADKVCNWDCVYCQVDRTTEPARRDVDLNQLRDELQTLLTSVADESIWQQPPFDAVPQAMRHVNDLAFSGDGEPTTFPQFDKAAALAVEARQTHGLDGAKVIVLSNMTMSHRDSVQRGLAAIYADGGEIWAKLDAGTEEACRRIDRGAVPFERTLTNIREAGQQHPLVIQAMFLAEHGQAPSQSEIEAWTDRIAELVDAGCRIRLVQVYTIAHDTTEAYVAPLRVTELQKIADSLKNRVPSICVEVYGGTEG